MKTEYDLSKMKREPNPYLKRLKTPITIRLRTDVVEYFKGQSAECGIPYQTLIDAYLVQCMDKGLKPRLRFAS